LALTANTVKRLASQLGALEGVPVPLDGGLTNHNYRARFGGREVVVRLPGVRTELLGSNRDAEREASSRAAAVGVAPALLASLEDPPCLVFEFVEGETMTPERLREPASTAALAAALRALHGCEPIVATFDSFRLVESYASFQSDRPEAPSSRLCTAPGIIFTSGAGCIASTARDMGAYVRMLAIRGLGPKTRLVSQQSFALFSTAHIKADEFGPTASYGYGIAVDRLDGHTVVRHTGGMVSFASALLVDLDAGVGAFASINAMQGYRPTPVVQFAARLMCARSAKQPLPEIPSFNTPEMIVNARDYEGVYRDAGGRETHIVREGERLYWHRNDERIALESQPEPDRFVVQKMELGHFPLVFGRGKAKGDGKGGVTEVSWGNEWYAGVSYTGPREFKYPATWDSYLGHYRNENPWIGSMRVVQRKGQLWLDGVIPLVAEGDRFMLRDEEHSPEWVRFGEVINGS